MTTAPKCAALVLPLRERKRRPCGGRAVNVVNGRMLCKDHVLVQRDRGEVVEPLPETKP